MVVIPQSTPCPPWLKTLSPDLVESPYFFLLESSLAGEQGRYSIAAFDPLVVYEAHSESDDPFSFLKSQLAAVPKVDAPHLPFAGGWIGYLGYELYSLIEKKVPARSPDLLPRAVLCFYDKFYVHDHRTGKSELVRIPYNCHCEERSDVAISRVYQGDRRATLAMTAADYFSSLQKIQHHIQSGDCYQVNFSQRFSQPVTRKPFEIYQRLREKSPAPYSAFLNLGEAQILSASPESFLSVEGRQVTTRPIKGTRARGKTSEEDKMLIEELKNSSKDQAELLMITDLERNDLGRVCEAGSIEVSSLYDVETFAQVHHLVATIRGKLKEGHDVTDLLRATFPGGSITGAPKVKAMELIYELEPLPRNVYCGSIGYVSLNGKSQWNIAIRTMVIKNNEATFWAGGGIVADSDPAAEYEEMMVKAKGMRESV